MDNRKQRERQQRHSFEGPADTQVVEREAAKQDLLADAMDGKQAQKTHRQ